MDVIARYLERLVLGDAAADPRGSACRWKTGGERFYTRGAASGNGKQGLQNSVDELISEIRQAAWWCCWTMTPTATTRRCHGGGGTRDAGHVNFMARQARGLVCLALTEERCRQLEFAAHGRRRGWARKPVLPLSIEAAEGIDTGSLGA